MKYYTAFGRVIATRINGVLSYNLVDHLGSTVQQIDSTNTPGPAIKYFPFGAPRNGTTSPERAFTGQQREDDSPLGMYYYHARFYSTTTGHFMSADSIAPTADNRGLNRYAYAANNPMRYTDPSGHCFNGYECTEWNSLQWIACGISGMCAARSSEEYNNMVHLARYALAQREFFEYVMAYAKTWGDAYRSAVNMFKGTFERQTKELHAGYFILGAGEEGERGAGGRKGPPLIPLEGESVVGSVKWKVTFTYLEFSVSAHLDTTDGSPDKAALWAWVMPGNHVSTSGWANRGADDGLLFDVQMSLFDPDSSVELRFSLNINPAAIAAPPLGVIRIDSERSRILRIDHPYGGPY